MMIRVADFVAQSLAQHGIKHVFMITGGGAMHLNDAIGRCKELTPFFNHHEQACAMAAESYYRLTNRLAAVNVTTGPGGINALNGVFGAWTDSLGMVVVSGQVRTETIMGNTNLPLRQLGDQEVDIIGMVKGITKYAQLINDPQSVRYHIEKAIHLAQSGRPGPTWIDIPNNIQAMQIDPDTLPGYDPQEDAIAWETLDLPAVCTQIVEKMRRAERPVMLVGPGVRLGGGLELFSQMAEAWGVPVITSFNAHDSIASDHPLFVGRQGTIGDRAGNFATQNADFVLILGCRMNIRQISYSWQYFARSAYKVMVDIDAAELKKPTLHPDLPVHADAAEVLRLLLDLDYHGTTPAHRTWLAWCQERKRRYPVLLPEYQQTPNNVNPYIFGAALFNELADDEVIVTGDGTACVTTFQVANLKPKQRLYSNSGSASMGYDLPAAIGASIATERNHRIVCLAGDGSIQMNLQELQTIVGYNLPIKIFIYNNQGYHSIRQTQHNFFPGNIIGCGVESGLSFPDMSKIAYAYGIPFRRCDNHDQLEQAIRDTLAGDGPQICEVMLDLSQQFAPRSSSKRLPDGRLVTAPLEDMYPFLDRDEFLSNMLIEPMTEE